jgi:phage-related holin
MAVVFDHLATTHRELRDMTIVFTITREKVFIVTGNRD